MDYRIAAVLFCVIALLTADYAAAQRGESGEDCRVAVWLIRAMRSASPQIRPDLSTRMFLQDAGDQLASLPFAQYRSVDQSEKDLNFRTQGSFVLADESRGRHMISIIPHSIIAGRVHFTVDWKDPAGAGLVNTKMRMQNGQKVMLGADTHGDMSHIVSVSILCPR